MTTTTFPYTALGLADLAKQQAAIEKKQQNLNKRQAVLEKASKVTALALQSLLHGGL